MSVLIVPTILGEPFHPELAPGTVLVVAGGMALTRERIRPHDFKALGAALALSCAGLFAIRALAVAGLLIVSGGALIGVVR